MNRSKHQEGFSLLEAMLAVLILMMGVVGITQLTRSMVASVSPANRGPLPHAEIVDHLLRDEIETMRARPTADALHTGAVLVMSGATYSVRADLVPPVVGPVNGFSKATYTATAEYEAPGAAKAVVGTVNFDKIVGPAKGGL